MQSEEQLDIEEEALKALGELPEEMSQEEKDNQTKVIASAAYQAPKTISNPTGTKKPAPKIEDAKLIKDADPLEVKKREKAEPPKEVVPEKEFVNNSKNPLVKLLCCERWKHLEYAKHDLESLIYTYMSRYQDATIWAIKCSVVPVDGLKEDDRSSIYMEYIKGCQKVAKENPDHQVFGVNLEFMMD